MTKIKILKDTPFHTIGEELSLKEFLHEYFNDNDDNLEINELKVFINDRYKDWFQVIEEQKYPKIKSYRKIDEIYEVYKSETEILTVGDWVRIEFSEDKIIKIEKFKRSCDGKDIICGNETDGYEYVMKVQKVEKHEPLMFGDFSVVISKTGVSIDGNKGTFNELRAILSACEKLLQDNKQPEEKYIERLCSNCEYNNNLINEYPCKDCFFQEKYQSKKQPEE